LDAFIAALPILIVLVLLAGLRMSAMKAMPIGWVVTVLIAAFYWKMYPSWIAAATIKGGEGLEALSTHQWLKKSSQHTD